MYVWPAANTTIESQSNQVNSLGRIVQGWSGTQDPRILVPIAFSNLPCRKILIRMQVWRRWKVLRSKVYPYFGPAHEIYLVTNHCCVSGDLSGHKLLLCLRCVYLSTAYRYTCLPGSQWCLGPRLLLMQLRIPVGLSSSVRARPVCR